MEVTATVLHEGALAEYEVSIGRDGACFARLCSYNGAGRTAPPDRLTLRKEGRHWISNVHNKTLSENLGYAVEMKAKPLLERKRDGRHPAG